MTAASVNNVVSVLCGIALLYMVLGSLASLAFPNAVVFRSSCTPGSLLQTLTQCDSTILNRMWSWTVGIPRFLLAWPILALLQPRLDSRCHKSCCCFCSCSRDSR